MLWGKVNLFTAPMSWEIGGEESEGGKKEGEGFRKDFTNVQGKQTKQRTTKWSEKQSFKARRLIFKKNFISILSTEGRLFKKTKHTHTVKPLDQW